MAGGYKVAPQGMDAIAARFSGLQRQIDAIRAGGNVSVSATPGASTSSGGVSITVPGLKLDGTDEGYLIQRALDKVKAGTRATEVLVHGKSGQKITIASTVQVESDYTTLRFDIPIQAEPGLRLRIFGATIEVPEKIKPKLEEDAPVGTTVLHLSDVSYFAAGDLATIRGNRDGETGLPLQRESFNIVSVDRSGNTITIQGPGLLDDYVPLNDTDWDNKYTQVTKVVASTLTGTPKRGDLLIRVRDSSLFPIGSTVQIIDDEHSLDGDGTIQPGNYVHREITQVIDTPSATSVLISHPLFHSYNTTLNARMALIKDVTGSKIVDAHVTFSTTPDDPENVFECRYGLHSRLQNCHVYGLPGKSWKNQAFRLTDSLDSWIIDCSAIGADDVNAGRGYGAAMYGATMCGVIGGQYTGCRHSVLLFNGASGNIVYGVKSSGVRISDYDAHGADCNDNLFYGCTAVGGAQNTPDSVYRTAFKIGNPSHYPGDNRNTVIACKVINYPGTAFEVIPTGRDNVFKGNTITGTQIGFRVSPLVEQPDLTAFGAIIADNDFHDVTVPFMVTGGVDGAAAGLQVTDNRWHRCGPMTIDGAPQLWFTGNHLVDPIVTTSYALTLTNSPGARVTGNSWVRNFKGIRAAGCPDLRVVSNFFHDQDTGISDVVFDDGGGNDRMLFRRNDIWPVGLTSISSGTGPSPDRYIELTSGTGGGTEPPAPGGTLPGAPTAVTAIPGEGEALVNWTEPASPGSSPIIRYFVTASTGQTATGTESPILVTGLATGVPVTFTVRATNSYGTGPASAPSAAVTPTDPPTPPAGPTYVHDLGTAEIHTSSASVELTTMTGAAEGNTVIIAACCNGDPGAVVVTDSAGNHYRANGSPVANGTATTVMLFSSLLGNDLPAGGTITVAFGSPRSLCSVQAHEFHGLPTDGLDAIAVGVGSAATALTTGTMTTSQANDLVFAAFAMSGNGTAPALTKGTDWELAAISQAATGSSSRDMITEYLVRGVAGPVIATATVATSKNYAGVALAYPSVALPTGGGSGATGTYSTFLNLQAAASIAVPGDVITMAASTTFAGRFELTDVHGTEAQPIIVQGPATAIIDSGDNHSGYGVHLDQCSWVTLRGFQVTNAQKGVMIDRSQHLLIEDLEVHHIGHEGIHLRNETTDCIVQGNNVHDTGLFNDDFGEGLYCGTAVSNWDSLNRLPEEMRGFPDRSDNNQFLNNTISACTAECMDVKEGTRGGVLAGNTFDGSLIAGANSSDSWVDVKGESWTISGNTGTTIMTDGYQTHRVGTVPPEFTAGDYVDGRGVLSPMVQSGCNNVFDANTSHCSPATGYGFWAAPDTDGNVVYTNNVIDGATSGRSNIPETVHP